MAKKYISDSFVKTGGTSAQYLMADGSVSTGGANWYPTAFAWTGGATAGPTGSLSGTGMTAVSYAAIPSASATASGIVTTTTQTFGGTKSAVDWALSSDRRLKTNIVPLEVKAVDVDYVEFEYKSDLGRTRFGVIAQDIQKNYPELVTEGDDGMLSVSYIDLLLRKISYLEQEVEKLKNK
jgi:prepilin-type processing-associated H-X9-DG protein